MTTIWAASIVAGPNQITQKNTAIGLGDGRRVTVGLNQYFSVVGQSTDQHFRLISDIRGFLCTPLYERGIDRREHARILILNKS